MIYNKINVPKLFDLDLENLKIEIIYDKIDNLVIYKNDLNNKNNIERLIDIRKNLINNLKNNKEIIKIINILNYYLDNTNTNTINYFKEQQKI